MFVLALNTLSDPYLTLALGTGVAAIGLTVGLLLVIVYLRLSLRTRLCREEAVIAQWRPLLLEAVSGATLQALPVLQQRDQLFFLKLWNYLQESLRGTANAQLNALAKCLNCDRAARSLLKNGKRAERLLAILTLGHLRDFTAWEDLAVEAMGPDSLASIHAARALAKIDPLRATEFLLPLMLGRDDWDITQVANLLDEGHSAFWLHLSKNLIRIDKRYWTRALQLADALHLQLPLQSMLFILENSPSVETLVAALHMASGLQLLPTVRSYLQHPDWRVRVEVARFLSSVGDMSDISALQQLLQDEQWWVRYQAAQSLVGMPFFGREQLVALRAETGEILAMDMLDHVLAEHSIAMT